MSEMRSLFKCKDCFFRNLWPNEIDTSGSGNLCNNKNTTKYPKGTNIVIQGEEIKSMIYLKSGLVKLYRHHPDEQDQIIRIARPEHCIGLLSVFSEERYNYSVAAIENSEICFLDLEAIKQLVRTDGSFALSILSRISRTSDEIINVNLEIGKKNLRGRIAYILLYFSKDVYGSASFEIPVSRKEIAELIDMTVENVIRIISEFGKDKILKVKRSHIEILDADKLRKICDLG